MDLFLNEVDYSKMKKRIYIYIFHFFEYLKGIEMIFRISVALLEIHQDELMLLSMEDMLKVTF
jgi:hypothetical protein